MQYCDLQLKLAEVQNTANEITNTMLQHCSIAFESERWFEKDIIFILDIRRTPT